MKSEKSQMQNAKGALAPASGASSILRDDHWKSQGTNAQLGRQAVFRGSAMAESISSRKVEPDALWSILPRVAQAPQPGPGPGHG